jgi:formate dehydrogenase iron-sulfur subunit
MPDLAWNYYNLIRFNEHTDEARQFSWLMRKDGCMHCADPGCLRACPGRRRDRAVHQRHRRFPAGQLHRLPVLRDRLSVQYSEVQSGDEEGSQVHAVLGPRGRGLEPACIKACPTGCLHFGTKDDMKDLAKARRSFASTLRIRTPAFTIRPASAERT